MNQRAAKLLIHIVCIVMFTCNFVGCASVGQPKNPHNLKDIFDEKTSWYYAARKSSKKWNVPISAMMAIMYQESSYRHDAQPPRDWFLFIPLPRNSSAYGYAQAQNGTWDKYTQEVSGFFQSRSNFADAIDFIGWYMNKTRKFNNIPATRVDLHYLNYHDGWGGFKKGTYKKKTWLLQVASKVQQRAKRYRNQLRESD